MNHPTSRWVTALGALAATGAVAHLARRRYRHDLAAANARLAEVDRHRLDTPWGTVEYAEEGAGDVVLVSHGIFHGCDGGLLSARSLLAGRHVVCPSRFGYLGSSLPPTADGAAQADALVALLDELHLDTVDVLAVSAGTTAAVQLALRHPGRVDHLVISSGNFPGSPTSAAPPGWARVFYSDPAMWAMRTLARPAFGRLMGVPDGFPRTAEQAAVVDELLDSIFPVGPRVAGAVQDAYVTNPEINDAPLEQLGVPTLVLHTRDDPLASYGAAEAACRRIPGAVLVPLDSGGHLQLGQTDRARDAVGSFLGP